MGLLEYKEYKKKILMSFLIEQKKSAPIYDTFGGERVGLSN